ncbi:MAG: 4Fe-4S binding protein [Candidatus Magnetomorum sp.]|nr:4Fe-4S binding protein [Candidatus Magnetomorum sp.]
MTKSIHPFQKFAENMLHKDSRYLPEILALMINKDQGQLLVSLPGTPQEMSEKLNRPISDIEQDLKDMFRKGLAFKKVKNDSVYWRAPAHLVQFHDASLTWPEATQEFYTAWHLYMEEEWPKLAPLLTQLLPRPVTRVIPVGKSIDTGKVKVLSPENVREIIDLSSKLAVTNCTCRLSMRQCDAPLEVCLQVNRGAEYTIERGSGREISKSEAYDIIEKAENSGLVHVTMNKADVGTFICNCCGCCCQSFTLLISDGLALCDPSRFIPQIDTEVCTACEACVERCWFNAIQIKDGHASVLEDKCLGCGQCAVGCPESAIQLVEKRSPDFIPE